MIIEDIEAFCDEIAPMRPLLGLDLGEKTIGVAASDRLLTTANAVETIKRRTFGRDAARLLEVAKGRDAVGLILGLPRNMDGSEGARCQSTRAFAHNLERLTDLPIGFWDERLSTVAAERALIAADLTRKRRSEVINAVAATYILQGALDRVWHIRAGP